MATKTKTERAGQQQLIVKRRPAVGSRPTQRLRGDGQVPGVVYGHQMEPLAIAISYQELAKLLHSKTGEHSLVTLRLDDAKPWERPALVKAVQHDPIDGHIVHVDFQTITLTQRIRVKVPVLLKGESVGVKQESGVLEQFVRELEVECLPTEIPTGVEFDVSALVIGSTVHVRDLTAPPKAKLLSDPNGVVASVQAPKVEKVEEAAAAAPTEPEVIREKKPEAEEGAAEEPKKGEKAPATDEKKDEKRKSGA